MPNLPWRFEKRTPGAVQDDPAYEEFFIGASDSEYAAGVVDSLIRESIQNAIDARIAFPIRVTFAIKSATFTAEDSEYFFANLWPHVGALEDVNAPIEPMTRWLVYEDFGAHGLCGDPARTTDPPPGDESRQDFYWFWRNYARSRKTGDRLGRWGLGKTVFPSSSEINTIFGLTKRTDDGRKLLMGQSVLKNHSLPDGSLYRPYGLLCDPADTAAGLAPIAEPTDIQRFTEAFGLQRRDEPGLSIVVPYARAVLSADQLLRAACVHYFVPIIKGQLRVEVTAEDGTTVSLDADTIDDVMHGRLRWDGSTRAKLSAPPPAALTRWACDIQETGQFNRTLPVACATGAITSFTDIVSTEQAAELLGCLENGDRRVAVRVPIMLETIAEGVKETYFDLFLAPNDKGKGEAWHVRDGMTITGVMEGKLTGGAFDGLMVVSDKLLSSFLGDAEGPAHVDWSTQENRLTKRWKTYTRRLQFVRGALPKFIDRLKSVEKRTAADGLNEVFSVPVKGQIPPRELSWFAVVQTRSGFSIRRSLELEVPSGAALDVVFAYDVNSGSPFAKSNWSTLDFEVRPDLKSDTLTLESQGMHVDHIAGNKLRLTITDPDKFSLSLDGFQPDVDLAVDVDEPKPRDKTRTAAQPTNNEADQ